MKGLSVPIGVNAAGGAATLTGDAQDQKIINLALSDDENDNAFQQDIGLGEIATFKDTGPRTRGEIIRRLTGIFRFFENENRFKLLPETVSWSVNSQTQEMVLEFFYLNIESDELRQFERSYSTAY